MPAGLQIWDGSSGVILDTTDAVVKMYDFSGITVTANGTIDLPTDLPTSFEPIMRMTKTGSSAMPSATTNHGARQVTVSGGTNGNFSANFRVMVP